MGGEKGEGAKWGGKGRRALREGVSEEVREFRKIRRTSATD